MSGANFAESGVKRINPRRPYRLNPEGIRRIVLGEATQGHAVIAPAKASLPGPKQLRSREPATEWHLAIVRADRGSLDDHARQAIAAAAILAQPSTGVLAVILGAFNGDVAALGADKAVVLAEFEHAYDPEREASLCAALIAAQRAKHVFLPDASDGTGDLGRRLVAEHGDPWATHAIELSTRHVAAPWSAGEATARAALPRFVLLAPGAVDTKLPFVGRGEMLGPGEIPALPKTAAAIRDLGVESIDTARLPLEEADVIVAGGNGVENVTLISALARELSAAVGASRVAVDEGKFARHQQIGATGKSVGATTYIAVGISGAVQHLQGIKDCRHVIAINRDPSAPIVQRADLTIVGDAGEVMQALLALIRAARGLNSPSEAA